MGELWDGKPRAGAAVAAGRDGGALAELWGGDPRARIAVAVGRDGGALGELWGGEPRAGAAVAVGQDGEALAELCVWGQPSLAQDSVREGRAPWGGRSPRLRRACMVQVGGRSL